MKYLATLLLITTLFACTQAELLTEGATAPDFTLTSESGDTVTLSKLLEESAVILVFYPGDNTPVCTKQLCELRDSYIDLGQSGATVLAINPADGDSHSEFKTEHNLPFPLLIDEGLTVASKYGTAGKRTAKRSVYVIGKDGKILFVQKGKPPVKDILAALKK